MLDEQDGQLDATEIISGNIEKQEDTCGRLGFSPQEAGHPSSPTSPGIASPANVTRKEPLMLQSDGCWWAASCPSGGDVANTDGRYDRPKEAPSAIAAVAFLRRKSQARGRCVRNALAQVSRIMT